MSGEMNGKRAIVTGPTSGIGKEIARGLAKQGAALVLACRNQAAGENTAREITERTGTTEIAVMPLDASSRQSIRDFAAAYRARYPRLDVLVNNAGLNRSQRHLSVDGIELTFATNVLGYFLLTRELLDLLKASAPARIVNVASTFASDLDLDDLQFERRPYNGTTAYAQSKACNRLLTWALARRIQGTRVTANAMAPGLVPATGLYRDAPENVRQMLSRRGGRTPEVGADTAVWLASSPDIAGVNGKFFYDREEIPCEFRNRQAEEKLWKICETLTTSS